MLFTCNGAHKKAGEARKRLREDCGGDAFKNERCAKALRDERQAEDWLARHCAVNGLSGCRDSAGKFVPTPACTGHARPSSGRKPGKKKGCKYGVVKSGPRKGKCRKTARR